MALVFGASTTASAASWQKAYLEPAVHAWMGVVTLLADDGEREGKKSDKKERAEKKCDGECTKGEGCKKCDGKCKGDCGGKCDGCRGKGDRKEDGKWHGHHRHGGHHVHMGPHDGPRGDALTMLHDINMRLGRIERMLAARGPGGPPPMAGHHHKHHGHHHGMQGPKSEMYQRMSEAHKKWENASPEERAEMKKKWEARIQEARKEKAEKAEKSEAKRPKVEDGAQRKAELENRLKRLEAELKRVRAALKASDS
jgi:hypothetical protein